MPEPLGLLWSMPETKKKAPIIKVSCGIGDTDGFPAFDVDSDAYDSKDDSRWGFLITGGAEFHMPLTVFQVTPNGLADKGGIRLGDVILEINEEDASQLSLSQAHEKINATPKKIHFLLRNMEEEDPMGQFEAGEEKSIVMRIPKPLPPPSDPPEPPKPKKKKTKTQLDDEGNEVVIELSEDESSDEEEQELPHHRIMRNIRRFFAEVGDNQELRSSTIENMLLALPSASKGRIRASSIEMRLLEMQRKLSAIAEIPKILSSTLATVSQSFGRLDEEEIDEEAYVQRKFSYDEDALDYELRDEERLDDTDSDEDDLVQVLDEVEDQDGDGDGAIRGGKQSKLLKDVTPESDYASEANYPANEASDDAESDDEAGSAVYFIKLPTATAEAEAFAEESSFASPSEDEDDSDFLSTTYTWNLRNVPKLRINDAEAEGELTLGHQKKEEQKEAMEEEHHYHLEPEQSKVRPATPTPQAPSQDSAEGQTQKLLFRLDKLERSWPWADREKIIYKQSTCHLVPRKPLGLVGQRMQLLLKDRKE